MKTITINSFNDYSTFLNENPTYQINDVNIISETEIIVKYTPPTI